MGTVLVRKVIDITDFIADVACQTESFVKSQLSSSSTYFDDSHGVSSQPFPNWVRGVCGHRKRIDLSGYRPSASRWAKLEGLLANQIHVPIYPIVIAVVLCQMAVTFLQLQVKRAILNPFVRIDGTDYPLKSVIP